MTEMPFIPVCEPKFDGNERAYLNECIDTGWVSSEGPFVRRLEDAFSASCNRKHCSAVSSGTAALDIAIAALDLQPGDEVILPTFTIISCAQAVVRAGATPVLVDVNAKTLTMDVAMVAERITQHTRAIMVVHLYGLPADMDPLMELARKHDLRVIEDAAEMHGQTYKGQPCGSFGDVSIFSLYANKFVTAGEGGLVLTNNDELAQHGQKLKNLCFEPGKRFVHEELGWNYRMTNLQAAVALAQFERLGETVAFKREVGRKYNQQLADITGLKLPPQSCDYAESVYWIYGLELDDELPIDGEAFSKLLAAKGIGTRPYFWPMHEQPVFQDKGLFAGEQYPVSERLARRGIYIPNGMGVTDEQIDRVCRAIKDVMAAHS